MGFEQEAEIWNKNNKKSGFKIVRLSDLEKLNEPKEKHIFFKLISILILIAIVSDSFVNYYYKPEIYNNYTISVESYNNYTFDPTISNTYQNSYNPNNQFNVSVNLNYNNETA